MTRVSLPRGQSGLRHWAGYISEEFLPELRGVRGYKLYDEMRRNEPVIVGLLTAMEVIAGRLDWHAKPDDDTDGADLAAAQHINRNLKRMRRSWSGYITDIMTMLPFGWSLFDQRFAFAEGKVWWYDFVFMGQDTLYRWEFDDFGAAKTFIQMPPPTYEQIPVPMERCLHFRTRDEKDNPEGWSILRGAYKPYYYKKVIEEIEAMGAERDLLGIPVMDVPYGATADEVAIAQSLVENIKNDDQAGVVLTAIGPEVWQRFNLHLLTGQGSGGRVSYTDRLVQRYTAEISMVALASFLHVGGGRGATANYSLGSGTRDLFQTAVKYWLGRITDVFDERAIPRLLAMNGMSGKCHLEHGRITQLDLQIVTNFITAAVQNKLLTPDRELEQYLREEAELPQLASSKDAASDEPPAPPPMALPPGLAGAGSGGPGASDGGGTSGPTANPGENQHGIFAPNAAAKKGGAAGGGVAPGNPANPPAAPAAQPKAAAEGDNSDEPDDNAIWSAYSERVLKDFADFWE